MSVKIMGQVWELDVPHAQMLVLLALADHADHEGGNIYPSINLVAWKTGYSERQVQRIIGGLVRDGLLIKAADATSRRPTTYQMNLLRAPRKAPYTVSTPDKLSPQRDDILSPQTSAGVTKRAIRGDIHDTRGDILAARGDIAMAPDPSWEPSEIRHEIRQREDTPAGWSAPQAEPTATRQSNGEPVQLNQPVRPARNPTPRVPPAPPAPPAEAAQPRLVETADADPVAIYREVAKVAKPNEAQRAAIRARVTERVEIWREVCERWRRQGWNARAVDNLLDAYAKGVADAQRAEAHAAAEAAERRRKRDEDPRCTPEQRAENLRRLAERAREVAAMPSRSSIGGVAFTPGERPQPPRRPDQP